MKRIDAHLSSLGYCSRSEAKLFLKKNIVTINNERVFKTNIKAKHEDIKVNDEVLDDEKVLILLHKPKDYICSHNDAGKLIYSLLPKRLQNRNPKVSTIGRLDIDTSGAMLLTDDGELNHRLSSPKNSVKKQYLARLADDIDSSAIEIFAKGDILLNSETKPLKPAKLEIIDSKTVKLEIVEGRYHQVKRMFAYLGNKVVALHRISFADFGVDDLKEGEFKFLDFPKE